MWKPRPRRGAVHDRLGFRRLGLRAILDRPQSTLQVQDWHDGCSRLKFSISARVSATIASSIPSWISMRRMYSCGVSGATGLESASNAWEVSSHMSDSSPRKRTVFAPGIHTCAGALIDLALGGFGKLATDVRGAIERVHTRAQLIDRFGVLRTDGREIGRASCRERV